MIDLAITPGHVKAKVLGSELYDVVVRIDAVTPDAWRAIQRDCAGSIGSLVDLLAGNLSESVMARLCVERTGLFPAPKAIEIDCSCPDYASMCKHVAAVLYGVGARFDRAPELLFTLRKVSADELLASVAGEIPGSRPAPKSARVLAGDVGLGAMFGIELAEAAPEPTKTRARQKQKPKAKAKLNAKAKTKPKAKAKAKSK